MTARNVLGFVVLVAAAAGSWYLTGGLRGPIPDEVPRNARSDAFYLRNARVFGTNEQGRPLYEIEAEYAEQLPDEKVQFQNVHISYSPEAAVPWTLNADTATLGSNQDRVVLSGHVVAVSEQGFDGEVTEIRAPHLEFDPQTYRVETDTRVQIRVGSRSVNATGMLALLQENRLQLKSNVSGKFVP